MAAEEMEAPEEMEVTVETEDPAATAEMVLRAQLAPGMARPQMEEAAVLPAAVAREVMVAQAVTVAEAATGVLSISRLRRTSVEASTGLPARAPAAVVVQAAFRARADLLVRQVQAVAAPADLTVQAVGARGQLEELEVRVTAVMAGIPDKPAVMEVMAVQTFTRARQAVGSMKTANVTVSASKEPVLMLLRS